MTAGGTRKASEENKTPLPSTFCDSTSILLLPGQDEDAGDDRVPRTVITRD